MENKKAILLNIKKNEIVIKFKKKRHYSRLFVLPIIAILFCFSFNLFGMKNMGLTMSKIFNPVNSLYNDNSDVIFTGGNLTINDFSVPLMGANYKIENGTIYFEVKSSIMVKSCGSGIVDEVGISIDGVKYIKIKHSEEIWSLYQNVDILGVQKDQIVKKGQDIATAKVGALVVFQMFNGDAKINNIKINSTKIIWED